ncbi:MAG: RHS repeat domain-containing protein [Planctomycetota bacterium]
MLRVFSGLSAVRRTVARQDRDLNADDDSPSLKLRPTSFGDDDEVVWYHANTLYSVYALTDGSDNVVERYRYDAYGACTVLDSDFSDDADNASDVANPYAFTARRLDAESALMQFRHRYCAPDLGRFISRDPAGYGGTPHLYRYVSDRPTFWSDPAGLRGVVVRPRKPHKRGVVSTALDVRDSLDERYCHEEDDRYHWGHSHCVTNCMMKNLQGVWSAWSASLFKEMWDEELCVRFGSLDHCYSAYQDSDYEANRAGRAADDFEECDCVDEGTDENWDACLDRCIHHCNGEGWGPEHRATPPGPLGKERGMTKEKDGDRDFRKCKDYLD